MIISISNARICYDEILKKVQKRKGKVIIYVSIEIDSLTSLRILVSLLKADNIRYEIHPVVNYDLLETKIEELKPSNLEQNETRAIVMLNCGGTYDITRHWFCEATYDILCLIIDTHRPTHHNNIHEPRCIVLIDDKYQNYESCPKSEDIKEIEENSDEDECEEGEEDQEEFYQSHEEDEETENNEDKINVKEEAEGKRKKLRKKKENLEDVDLEGKTEAGKIEEILASVQRGKTKIAAIKDEKKLKREIRKKKREMIRRYYSGSYYGQPASYVLFHIATQLHREDISSLWYLIISITEHYLQANITTRTYDELHTLCHSHVLRLKPTGMTDRRSLKTELNDEDKPLIAGKWDDVKVKSSNYDTKTIIMESDYHLYMFRHWNLFDSFVNSNYTLGKLKTWKEPGKFEIQKLFAYIGVPLDEAKQKYTFMKNDNKKLFKLKIREISSKFELGDILFNSFVYQFDQITQLSASDFCHITAAILDYPFPINDLDLGLGEGYNQEEGQALVPKESNKYDNFWTAYYFLSLKDANSVKKLSELAIKLQQAIVRTGTEIIDKRSFTSNPSIRYSIINSDLSDESKYFHHALSLKRLAMFTIETIYRSSYKQMEPKPYMIAMLNSKDDSYLVAGIHGKGKYYDDYPNQFSLKFKLSAQKIGAKVEMNSFDECVVKVKKDDFAGFLEEVCNF